jgi:hypothetical protein
MPNLGAVSSRLPASLLNKNKQYASQDASKAYRLSLPSALASQASKSSRSPRRLDLLTQKTPHWLDSQAEQATAVQSPVLTATLGAEQKVNPHAPHPAGANTLTNVEDKGNKRSEAGKRKALGCSRSDS